MSSLFLAFSEFSILSDSVTNSAPVISSERSYSTLQELILPFKRLPWPIIQDPRRQRTSSYGLCACRLSLQLYRVKDIPQQHSEIEPIHLTHHRCSHILLSDSESSVQTSRDAIVQRNDQVKNTLVRVINVVNPISAAPNHPCYV